jgi:hypothetical protein
MSRGGLVVAGGFHTLAIAVCAAAVFLCPYALPRCMFVLAAAWTGFLLRDLLGEDWV